MKLKPENASCAIIIDKNENIILQKRDNKRNIFFPDHWGLFGGAKKKNEKYINTLKRELNEELGFVPQKIEFFINLKFDINLLINKEINRYCYICFVSDLKKMDITLNEGKSFKIFSHNEIIKFIAKKNKLVPYDYLALWIYLNKNKLIS